MNLSDQQHQRASHVPVNDWLRKRSGKYEITDLRSNGENRYQNIAMVHFIKPVHI